MLRRVRNSITFAVVLLAYAATASAQVDRATLTGIVRDPSDAAVAEAQVKVTSLATNGVVTATTTGDGTYLVVNLDAGRISRRGRSHGIPAIRADRLARDRARARASISRWRSASVTETVTVEGVTPLVNTENAVVGTVVSSAEVEKLPLAIRNWDDLLALVPGVQSDRYTEQSGGTASGRTGGVNVHGNRSLQNNFLLDGVANNSFSTNVQELSTQISRPSVDAIDEFKVVTSPYAAEYGWSPGRGDHRQHQVGHQQHSRHGLRLLPQRLARRDQLLRQARQPAEGRRTTRTSSAATLAGRSCATARSSSATSRRRASSRACSGLAGS